VTTGGLSLPTLLTGSRPDSLHGMKRTAFEVEPWCVRERALDLDLLARSESVFALSNGHVGLRGNLDEGEPHALPGTYLNSVYELRPLPYAEAGYGYPESGQTVINVTNGKIIRLLVDDEPFDVRYGSVLEHERCLDLRAGVLTRDVRWRSPAGRAVRIRSTRLVSLTHRSIVAIAYEVEPLDDGARIVLQSELVANEELPGSGKDPRTAAVLANPLEPVEQDAAGLRLELLHRTRRSGIGVAVAADHVVEGTDGLDWSTSSEIRPDWGRVTVTAALRPGQTLRLVKFVSYGWSSVRSRPALRDQVAAGLTGALHTGWHGLLRDQREFLDDFWQGADVTVEGDEALQQAVRFALFHVLQNSARAEERPIAAKGLTGPGYDGHCFWDTDSFVLPVLVHTWPEAAGDHLRWRHRTLDAAKHRAAQLRLEGAAFPWRTINGEECSGYWPAGTAAFHVNADVADAVIRYHDATRDDEFDAEVGLEILVETARLWVSLGHHDREGGWHVSGVTGPDEYSAISDDNVYTNLMAERNLRAAAAAVRHRPERAATLGVREEEVGAWLRAADAVVVPFDEVLGVHEQSAGFTGHAVWDFAATPADSYPLLLHYPYFDLYRKQVVKQADLVLAMQTRGDRFTPEQKAANFAYYEAITVRDSSLSAFTQAVLAAEVGCLDLAYAYACEAAFLDLHDLARNTRDGLHMASLAGAWIALVSGFGGMRDHHGLLSFAPRLPPEITRLSFTIRHRGHRLRVTADAHQATYTLFDHDSTILLRHHGTEFTVRSGEPLTAPVPPPPTPPKVTQPPGREPLPRSR
jgi:alpha,alpha-trehalose phosphorylase